MDGIRVSDRRRPHLTCQGSQIATASCPVKELRGRVDYRPAGDDETERRTKRRYVSTTAAPRTTSQTKPRSSGTVSSKPLVKAPSSKIRDAPYPGSHIDSVVGVRFSIGLWTMPRSRKGSRNAMKTPPTRPKILASNAPMRAYVRAMRILAATYVGHVLGD